MGLIGLLRRMKSAPIVRDNRFDVVIEGTDRDKWKDLQYKLVRVEALESTGMIDDGATKYWLYGRTDFKNVEIKKVNIEGSILKTRDIALCAGYVLGTHGLPSDLDVARSMCMRDGRVYVNESVFNDGEYIDTLPSLIKEANRLFNCKNASVLFGRLD